MSTRSRGELLYEACAQERLPALRRLLRAATAETLTWAHPATGWTALHVAAEMQSAAAVQLLASAGAPLEAVDRHGRGADAPQRTRVVSSRGSDG